MDNFDYNQQDFPHFQSEFDPASTFLEDHEQHQNKRIISGDSGYGNQSATLMNGSEEVEVFPRIPSTLANDHDTHLEHDDDHDSNHETHHSSSSSNKPKSKRTRATGEALEILKREFQLNPSPSAQNRKRISEMTGLPEKNVRIWFQNRRSKYRKSDRRMNGPGATDNTSLVSSFDFDKIPLQINSSYYFIDISSLTVGSWKRLKSGNLRDDSLPQIQKLSNLSPISINTIMANATDLMVLISKKNFEINYFFSAIANNTKILFRIFFPINTVVNCSLSLETTDSLKIDNKSSTSPSSLEGSTDATASKLAELRLSLSKSPKFAVYFSGAVDDGSSNQWSICEDFSEGRQVNDAFIGGSNIPHVLTGLDESLKFMNSLILDLNSSEHFQPPTQLQHGIMHPLPTNEPHPAALTFNDDPNLIAHDTSANPSHNSQSSFLTTNDNFTSMTFDNFSPNIPKTPDFLNSTNLQESQGMSTLLFQDQHPNGSSH
ncbi:unnamed protein product [Kluyveromyces dobzhanskii CBS 2104]|uniref:WGS project CCBQ000000000 data, contig 00102 n=1 Tax=Kluyveromyces dobzhanskii CBS 2104 TaxID=1427455 RepID=A0A0A8L6A5_9SACH|nr:unnamed protein product [Kluyveromyces dobzhanskii CBS 2104]